MKTKTKKSWMAKCIDEMQKNPEPKKLKFEGPGYMINGIEYDPVLYTNFKKKRDYYVFIARSDVIRTYPIAIEVRGNTEPNRWGGGAVVGDLHLYQQWYLPFDWSIFKQPVLYPDPVTNTYVPFNPEVHA